MSHSIESIRLNILELQRSVRATDQVIDSLKKQLNEIGFDEINELRDNNLQITSELSKHQVNLTQVVNVRYAKSEQYFKNINNISSSIGDDRSELAKLEEIRNQIFNINSFIDNHSSYKLYRFFSRKNKYTAVLLMALISPISFYISFMIAPILLGSFMGIVLSIFLAFFAPLFAFLIALRKKEEIDLNIISPYIKEKAINVYFECEGKEYYENQDYYGFILSKDNTDIIDYQIDSLKSNIKKLSVEYNEIYSHGLEKIYKDHDSNLEKKYKNHEDFLEKMKMKINVLCETIKINEARIKEYTDIENRIKDKINDRESMIEKIKNFEQDIFYLKGNINSDFEDQLDFDTRRKWSLLEVDLKAMESEIMSKAKIDTYKLQQIQDMQRKAKKRKHEDLESFINHLQRLRLEM